MKRMIHGLAILFLAMAAPADAGEESSEGRAKYESACAPCHGAVGRGDGSAAAAFPPGIVTNLQTGPFRYAADAGKLKEVVRKGGAAVGLSPLMPPQPAFTDEQLDDLAVYVLGLRSR